MRNRALSIVAVVWTFLLVGRPAPASPKTSIDIGPGPTTMSDEEKAIVADPSKGIEHGVILLEESENAGMHERYIYHLRAKILSPEAASLGDVVIPFNTLGGSIYKWWGRTILPDGKVLELDRKALVEQKVLDVKGGRTVKELRGALPGVVPGCVIDYGYEYGGAGYWDADERLILGRSWPILQLRHRWIPAAGMVAAYSRKNVEGLSAQVVNDKRSLLITASNLPTFKEEPWGPPIHEIQPGIKLYYIDPRRDYHHFWKETAKEVELKVTDFFHGDEAEMQETLAGMKMPADADLMTKLRVAYDWVVDNIENLGHRSSEDREKEARERTEKGKKEKRDEIETAGDVLKLRKGYGLHIDRLFIGLARELGAEAHEVDAPDRTVEYWDKGIGDAGQLHYRMVAVWKPGDPQNAVVVSPGDGLEWGEVPWWTTGTSAMIATKDDGMPMVVPPLPPQKNLVEDKAQIQFDDDIEMKVRWSRHAFRQRFYIDRINMISMTPDARRKTREGMCGASSQFDVTKAETSALERLREPLELSCEGTMPTLRLDGHPDKYELEIGGPWISAMPEFPESTRKYPIVFPYPRCDVLFLDVKAPSGYLPGDPFRTVKLESRYGTYLLSASATDAGFHVERTLTLTPIAVDPRNYAAIRTFLDDVKQADKSRLSFKKLEEGP